MTNKGVSPIVLSMPTGDSFRLLADFSTSLELETGFVGRIDVHARPSVTIMPAKKAAGATYRDSIIFVADWRCPIHVDARSNDSFGHEGKAS